MWYGGCEMAANRLMPYLLLAVLLTACASRCTLPQTVYQNETAPQRLMREQQDAADFAVLQAEKAYERMSDAERMRGVVYEGDGQ